MNESVLVIGAGSSGLFTSLDLATRGMDVTLIDRSTVGAGTSWRFHGVLHSGARYAVSDAPAARECNTEASVLRKIASHCIEETGGMYVALSKDDVAYGEKLLDALEKLRIRHLRINGKEAIEGEPNLSRDTREGILVPDGVLKGGMFLCSLVITAMQNGVTILPRTQVSEFHSNRKDGIVSVVLSGSDGRKRKLGVDAVVCCTGPWTAHVLKGFGVRLRVLQAAGAMVVIEGRHTFKVISRMRPPSDGDIVVPYGWQSIVGTTSEIVRNPDRFVLRRNAINRLLKEASAMLPSVSASRLVRCFHSVRPLIHEGGAGNAGRSATRDFNIESEAEGEKSNLISVIGGKMTTSRLVGEKAADAVCKKLGVKRKGKTVNIHLFNPYRNAAKEDVFPADGALPASLLDSMDADYLLPAMMLEFLNRQIRGGRA
ncbi:MAG: FAD-dependent oxidoreductase [Methanomassiliicoccales archaeon]